MENFGLYSKYYDLLYADKEYEKEAEYVMDLIRTFNKGTASILEFGSGTGKHGKLFKAGGFEHYGIERSNEMVEEAHKTGVECEQGDITSFKLDKKFGVVISLFHVISYLTTNKEVNECFTKANEHLEDGGLFIFDTWYTPAVYFNKPENRIRKVGNELLDVTRFASPAIHYNSNIVDVNFTVFIKEKADNRTTELVEKHPMRHFSIPEIALFAEINGFAIERIEEFLSGQEPSENTWGVCFVLRKFKNIKK